MECDIFIDTSKWTLFYPGDFAPSGFDRNYGSPDCAGSGRYFVFLYLYSFYDKVFREAAGGREIIKEVVTRDRIKVPGTNADI